MSVEPPNRKIVEFLFLQYFIEFCGRNNVALKNDA